MNIPELLAPAGSYECLEAAYSHGADAAYVGIGTFNLRAHSKNFMIDELPSVLSCAKKYGKKLYAVLNTMPTDTQLVEIEVFVKELSKQTDLPDAFIVSDPGVIALCQEYLPDVELHLSTQTGTFNKRSLQFWKDQGISRVVLPRELNLEQINYLCKSTICETELFVHGAMCVSISGRCLIGAYLSGRHANHGDCPQPCRYEYSIAPKTQDNSKSSEWFDAKEDANGVYLLNSKDLNTISILPEIIKTGVSSLKIEGRNKSVHYVSAVVKTYRAAINAFSASPETYNIAPEWLQELDNLDHRSYTTGFFNNEYLMQDTSKSKVQSKIRVVGVVKAISEGALAVIDVKNPFFAHEELNILPVNHKILPFSVSFLSIQDVNDRPCERAITNRIVKVESDTKLSIGDIIRRMV